MALIRKYLIFISFTYLFYLDLPVFATIDFRQNARSDKHEDKRNAESRLPKTTEKGRLSQPFCSNS